ncbi:bifunctional adenosylcobinamide kinase/adenosylcobinamide-phosphate guanylyltransferase [Anoxybacillus sp. J5B_2022]|uniref:bifunctional adenosylcobinamide kinase/adenosylcobinamide-phosphate guanylyltransferase n=1 Tax=Anoxybacillus sp. J5B_2022 TaxID=3003246 RepID=UPI002286A8BD|nr:bifunctional adenosylcobinamide kinase/adenosylcobinamide-phosphate guanylyltransferase [Anoxybacillus sp. J5B_2022]MCZ0754547.1 bifunctional adenosylcobinamide kinase/adenosylcobinamide-phosphate guanylyltransferase [Anoxybacillus sp. J5B_2022]
MIVFISGGVRSGKSGVAERCVRSLALRRGAVHYIATANVTDDEIRERVIRHQQERRLQPIQWVTWEQPRNVHELTGQFRSEDVILLDCLTNWLANELFHEQGWENETYCRQKAEQMLTTITQLATVTKAVVIVSNEVFFGGVPQDIGTYHFMKMLGWLHQRIVQLASCAIVVQHGIPIVKKGDNCL